MSQKQQATKMKKRLMEDPIPPTLQSWCFGSFIVPQKLPIRTKKNSNLLRLAG